MHFVVDLYYYSNTVFMKVTYIIQYHTPLQQIRMRSQPYTSRQSTEQQRPSVCNGIWIMGKAISTGKMLWFREQIAIAEILISDKSCHKIKISMLQQVLVFFS